ncbi:MAG: type II toxin-antitoxin system Phd/YefM family antitoxin [Nitrococcus sp.]|nr:type II toxin-antitoxin system Phd/YefM family antitoxin [Nitrococcus sp.]
MDFVTLREFRTQPGKIWEKLTKQHELVVTRNGKPFALLTETSPTSLDEDLAHLRRARFGRALTVIRDQAKARGLDKLSTEDVNALIRDARKARRETGGT